MNKDRYKIKDLYGFWLNWIASIIIIFGMFYFWNENQKFKTNDIKKNKYNEINITLSEKDKTDINKLIIELQNKTTEIQNLKDSIEIDNKNASEKLKYYITLVGFILTIVGFFGFKSIHDTRQAAIERAVSEAKNEAIKEAREASKQEALIASKTEARSVAETEAEKVARTTAIKTSKDETLNFLSDEFPKQFRIQEEKYISSFTDDLKKVSEDIDKIKNPRAYKQDNNKIKLFEELEKLDNKYSEILEIITEIKIKYLKNDQPR